MIKDCGQNGHILQTCYKRWSAKADVLQETVGDRGRRSETPCAMRETVGPQARCGKWSETAGDGEHAIGIVGDKLQKTVKLEPCYIRLLEITIIFGELENTD